MVALGHMICGGADEDDAFSDLPERPLSKGMSLVADRVVNYGGVGYVRTAEGKLVPKHAVRWGGDGSKWSGVFLQVAAL